MSKDTKYAAFDFPIEIRTGVIGIYRLVGQMRWVLAHPDLAVEMGREARKFARVYFSTHRYVQGYRQAFSLALDSHQSGVATD